MNVSNLGVQFTGSWEGLRLVAYQCQAGVWTIGYGTTRINGKPVTRGMRITEEQALAYKMTDLQSFVREVNRAVNVPLTQNQFDALVSFTYNMGGTSLRSSTLLKVLNEGNYKDVPSQLKRWVFARNPDTQKLERSSGLERRRNAEANLFSNGIYEMN